MSVRTTRAIISFQGVSKSYRSARNEAVHALRALDLDVFAGETLCLIGPSGSGKTTALRLVNRLEIPDSGRVFVEDRDTSEWDPIRLRRGIGYVVQSGGLLPHLTVEANIALLCRIEGHSRTSIRARVRELLDLVRLAPNRFAARYPSELSGGEAQRVSIARALALEPRILLMDEPFGALDPITRRDLHDEFLALGRTLATTVVIVTHDLDEAFRLGDRVALFRDGKIEQVGTRRTLEHEPASPFVERFVARHTDG